MSKIIQKILKYPILLKPGKEQVPANPLSKAATQ